ncbi:MAG: NAD-dependent epimerase/dehydratase family protein [Gammaproteobacteria bacterium]|nr:NAD-dependent epimerase/dehydratase family protein [Gammaproteobacteria bacterium]
MKLLITGGTGFIGSRLTLKSLSDGHSVRLLGQANNTKEEDNLKMLESKGVEVTLGSVTDRDAVFRAAQGCDVVFHLAAAQHEMNVPDKHYYDVNVEGTRNMLDASIEAGVQRFVHGSTIGVYGSALDGEIDEQSALAPDNIYGVTKHEGEALVLSYADQLPVSVIRISETYGPGDWRLLKLFKGIKKRKFFVIGDGLNKHQLIYVDDLIDGLFAAATEESAVGEIFTLAGSEVLSTREMVDIIANEVDGSVPKVHAPMWPFMTLAVLMEKTLRPLGIQPPLHPRRMNFFKKSYYFSRKKAETTLHYSPQTNFSKGVAETAKWYKEQGLLD